MVFLEYQHRPDPPPPVPSMSALPVDLAKTEPKPAFYKLQFGDDITGFSYYVQTVEVMIGRNVTVSLLRPKQGRS